MISIEEHGVETIGGVGVVACGKAGVIAAKVLDTLLIQLRIKQLDGVGGAQAVDGDLAYAVVLVFDQPYSVAAAEVDGIGLAG